jgi:hypothetical protein
VWTLLQTQMRMFLKIVNTQDSVKMLKAHVHGLVALTTCVYEFVRIFQLALKKNVRHSSIFG